MKIFKAVVVLMVGMLLVIVANCNQATEKKEEGQLSTENATLDTTLQKNSYVLGYNFGLSLKAIISDLDLAYVFQGIKDAAVTGKGKLNDGEMREIFIAFQKSLRERHMEKKKLDGEKNKMEGEQFLKENAQKEGVKTTTSGLQYMVLQEGTGPSPTADDRVKVHYRGTLLDGTEFDSSYKRGEPIVFALNGVIPGWTEGVQLMKTGAKYKFFIPSELAYKEHGSGQVIGPNATLIFEVELLEVNPQVETPQPGAQGQ